MVFGLDEVILDSTDKNLMALIKATDLLLGKDDFCGQYLKTFREGKL
jgi:5-methyltetrahydrofolate--homocysteine methyltransferase